jgi:hypothetical protein
MLLLIGLGQGAKPMKFSLLRHSALAICAAALLAGCRGSGGTVPEARNLSESQDVVGSASPFSVLPLAGVNRRQLDKERAAGKTIPFFSGSVKSPLDRKTYSYDIVGGDPQTSKGATYVRYVLILMVYHFRDGTILDPTKPACNDTVSIERRILQSPSFVPTALASNGVSLGTVQLGDAFQRAEFWNKLKSRASYHVVLRAARPPVVVHVKAPSGSSTTGGVCSGGRHRIGTVAYGPFSGLLRRLSKKYASSRQIPIFVNYNLMETFGSGGLAVGAHGAFALSSGIQPFIFAAYSDAGSVPSFPSIADVMALTHEIAELLNDPFPISHPIGSTTVNLTPPWGHIGVYRYGCSSYFEVGDPLVGVTFDVNLNGFTYHPQDLAFYSWFFRTKSIGTGGLYSFQGTFKTVARRCKGL